MWRFINRILKFISAVGLYSAINWIIDYVLYPVTIWHLGLLKGGALLAIALFIFDFLSVRFYDWAKADWLAIEYSKEYLNSGYLAKYNAIFESKYKQLWIILSVIILSMKFNPFIVSIVMREGAYTYSGLAKRDWIIFVTSHMISQLYWIAVVGGVLSLIPKIYSKIFY
jgi:hypothetical protein